MALQSTVALSTITLQGTATDVTFSSIPNVYRDLILVIDGIVSAGGGEVIRINFNGDTTSANYPTVYMDGNGSATSSSTENRRFGLLYPTRTVITASIVDYSATNKHKTWLSRAGAAANVVFAGSGRWANTAAINTIRIFPDANGFAAGSTFSLYGRIA